MIRMVVMLYLTEFLGRIYSFSHDLTTISSRHRRLVRLRQKTSWLQQLAINKIFSVVFIIRQSRVVNYITNRIIFGVFRCIDKCVSDVLVKIKRI